MKEITKHTPGPWRIKSVRGAAGQSKRVWVQQERTGTIAQIHAGSRVLDRPSPAVDEVNAIKDANARLIAAAPELLKAGRDLAVWLTGESHPDFQALAESEYDDAVNHERNPDSNHIKGEMVARLLGAIAKAEGRH